MFDDHDVLSDPSRSKPRIGIFWFVPAGADWELIEFSSAATDVEMVGGMRTYPIGHDAAWEAVRASHRRLRRYEFEFFPRGRVNELNDGKDYLLLADRSIIKQGLAARPKPADNWTDVKVFIPQRQRKQLVRAGIAPIVDAYRGRRIWPAQLASAASLSVFLVRRWMLHELAELGALKGATAIWSQWHGYLADGDGKAFRDEVAERGLPFHEIHTSGHASPRDLQRFAAVMRARRVVPIHTFQPEVFPALFENVTPTRDGEWQTI